MVERGIVTKIKRDKAIVTFDRKAACDKCRMCAVSRDKMKVYVTLKNTLNKQVGDIVSVQMGGKYVITAALIVYIIPLILTAVGLLVGMRISEMWQLILAGIGLVVGFVIAAILDKVLRKKQGFTPTMVENAEDTEVNFDIVNILPPSSASADAVSVEEAEMSDAPNAQDAVDTERAENS